MQRGDWVHYPHLMTLLWGFAALAALCAAQTGNAASGRERP